MTWPGHANHSANPLLLHMSQNPRASLRAMRPLPVIYSSSNLVMVIFGLPPLVIRRLTNPLL